MSPDLFTTGLAVVGTLLGVALGLYGERWFRNRGDVYCRVDGTGGGYLGERPFKYDLSVPVHLFNEKEVDTGLSDLTVILAYEGEKVVLGPDARDYQTSTSPRGVINLPSKTWVEVHIRGSFFGPQAILLVDPPETIEIAGKFPGGKPYHMRCSEPAT